MVFVELQANNSRDILLNIKQKFGNNLELKKEKFS